MSENIDKIFERVTAVWQLNPRKAAAGIYAMWQGERLRSFSVIGVRRQEGVCVPMLHWVTMRMMGDRLNVPTVVFFLDDSGSVYYANWPTTSAIGYPTLPDDTVGGVVAIVTSDFSLVETKK